MRVNKSGKLSIHLKDERTIQAVKEFANKYNTSMYYAAEELILDGLNAQKYKVDDYIDDIPEVIIDVIGYESFIKTLIYNGYSVTITPKAGETGLNKELIIKFRKEN